MKEAVSEDKKILSIRMGILFIFTSCISSVYLGFTTTNLGMFEWYQAFLSFCLIVLLIAHFVRTMNGNHPFQASFSSVLIVIYLGHKYTHVAFEGFTKALTIENSIPVFVKLLIFGYLADYFINGHTEDKNTLVVEKR